MIDEKRVKDLKEKIGRLAESRYSVEAWNMRKKLLQEKISVLKPEKFEAQIWSNVEEFMQKNGKQKINRR